LPALCKIKGSDCAFGGRAFSTSNQGGFAMLYCISANYTPKAMEAMAKNPNVNRQDEVEKLVKAAGGKVVAMYGTIADGPGAMVIIDVDPGMGAAIAAVVGSSDGLHNLKAQRIFSMDEVKAIRQKRIQLQASFRPPGQ
jgi:uncharacterized protein with GYD domain